MPEPKLPVTGVKRTFSSLSTVHPVWCSKSSRLEVLRKRAPVPHARNRRTREFFRSVPSRRDQVSWIHRRDRKKRGSNNKPKSAGRTNLKGCFVNVGGWKGLTELYLKELFEEVEKHDADFVFLSEVMLESSDYSVDRELEGWTCFEYLRSSESYGGMLVFVRDNRNLVHYL